MPLIACPDCERPVSDTAPACIHCGRPSPGAQLSPSGHDFSQGVCRRCGVSEWSQPNSSRCYPRRLSPEPTDMADVRREPYRSEGNPDLPHVDRADRGGQAAGQSGMHPGRQELLRSLRAYVGPRWDSHYRGAFEKLLDAELSGVPAKWTWNWAAALLPIWFLYRRLYMPLVAVAVFGGTITVLDKAIAGSDDGGSSVGLLLFLALIVAQGYFADRLLFRKARSVVTSSGVVISPARAALLGKPLAWVMWLPVAVVGAGVLAAILIPLLTSSNDNPPHTEDAQHVSPTPGHATDRQARVQAIKAETRRWANYYGFSDADYLVAAEYVADRIRANARVGMADVTSVEIRDAVTTAAADLGYIPHQLVTDSASE